MEDPTQPRSPVTTIVDGLGEVVTTTVEAGAEVGAEATVEGAMTVVVDLAAGAAELVLGAVVEALGGLA